ncbi:MAG TPA: Mrp/NBP35 family ATP-binding protein [Chloroflexi bacterium]|jgi:ATP-binding protein involved in chromosome partitioning|nr:Mrp/NBP35 family ATP-binding protein [Chloroflexota bacterium]HPO58722.1 Mrp/NBP35 family ATP-binding protein [Anaerolineaceae bacterium]
MISENEALQALRGVMDPELHRSIVDLGMVKDLTISDDGKVAFTLALTIQGCPMRESMAKNARAALLALPGVNEVEVTFGVMDPEQRKAIFGAQAGPLPRLNGFNRIGKVIAVMSGKGGVGKSSVTALLAAELARQGYKVGVLDADITGPSIPKLFGLPPGGLRGGEAGMLPAVAPLGIRVVSTNLMVTKEDTAVIWRGPVISATIRQFWEQTLWGRLDVLLVDLPPGTGDATLTVVQSLPLDGVLLVTSPQQLAAMVVRKAVRMLQQMRIPILGVVENMSYFTCPDTGHRHEIFGPSHAGEIAEAAGVDVIARLPINPEIATLGDAGKAAEVRLETLAELAGGLLERVPEPAAA